MTATERFPSVGGYCPMGCGPTLTLYDGDIGCSYIDCPDPSAASDILGDRETEHIVTFGTCAFSIRHPLRERLGDALLLCALHTHCERLDGPPARPGQYRATRATDGRWSFSVLDVETGGAS